MSGRFSEDIWQAVRDEYRAGALSIRAIAALFPDGSGPSEAGIRARAKKEKWERDLSAQVEAATRARQQREGAKSSKSSDIIENAAERNFQALQNHMKFLGELSGLEDKLKTQIDKCFDDLDKMAKAPSLEEQVSEILASAEEKPKGKVVRLSFAPPEVARAALVKVVAECMSHLTGTTAKRIGLERQALNLDKPDKDKPLASFIFHADFKGEARG